jgi:Protein of Unknown function (DUF2784)
MNFLFWADLVAFAHWFLIVGVLAGILISVFCKRFRPIESAILSFTIVIWSIYDGCPLTYFENYLRVNGGAPTSLLEQGFISYYIHQWSGVYLSAGEVTAVTYATVALFLSLTIRWEWSLIKKFKRARLKWF